MPLLARPAVCDLGSTGGWWSSAALRRQFWVPLLAGPAVLDSMSPTGNPSAWREFTLVQTRLGRSLALPQTQTSQADYRPADTDGESVGLDSMYELCVTPFTLRESPRNSPATRSPSLPRPGLIRVNLCSSVANLPRICLGISSVCVRGSSGLSATFSPLGRRRSRVPLLAGPAVLDSMSPTENPSAWILCMNSA